MSRETARHGNHTAKGIVVVVVLVALGVAVLARSGTSHSPAPVAARRAATTTTTTPSSTTTTLVPAAQIKLQVLNGVGTGLLAGEWSTKLKANPGYQTLTPLNATARVTSSSIYVVTPGFVPEADALAAVVGLPTSAVNTTTPPPASAPIPSSALSNANLVLVIGPDLAASA